MILVQDKPFTIMGIRVYAPTTDGRDGKNTWMNCIKKDLNEPGYYDDVVSHPESDILECEVKWALKSTAVNKVSNGCDGIPVELFKAPKDNAIKVLHSTRPQIWKT